MKTKVAIILTISAFSLITFYLIGKNTSFLNKVVPKKAVEKNNFNLLNQNQKDKAKEPLVLKPSKLLIPEKFKKGVFTKDRYLNIPEGYEAQVFATGFKKPRAMVFDYKFDIFMTDITGSVYLIKFDVDAISKVIEIDKGLRNPHGIDYVLGDLYVAEEHQVSVYRKTDANGKFEKKETLIKNLPSGAGHFTRTVRVIGNKIYVAIGSSCNLCKESDNRRASIVTYNLDGSGEEIFATGLRNTVDFKLHKEGLVGVDNGRDLIGDSLPPEEINIIKKGKHYGWPYCYGNKIPNPEYPNKKDFCQNQTEAPFFELPAHTAPLGITQPQISSETYITLHGSWNSSTPVGYKIVKLDLKNKDAGVENFVTGWLDETGEVWGRPVNTLISPFGELFISDDKAGVVYKLRKVGKSATEGESVDEKLKKETIQKGKEVVETLNKKDMTKLSTLVHPKKGVLLNLYYGIDPNTALILKKENIENAFSDNKEYLIGYGDGTGDPIYTTYKNYFETLIEHNFLDAEAITFNKTYGYINEADNYKDVFKDSVSV